MSRTRRTLVVRGPARLEGRAEAPPDKSVAHRALLCAAIAEGESTVRPHVPGRDVQATVSCLARLGVRMREPFPGELTVEGAGPPRDWPAPPRGPVALDCQNSGTTARLLAGLLTGYPHPVRFDGDASLRRRPMARLAPLRQMGAQLTGPDPLRVPFEITGTRRPRGAEVRLGIASAQVKSAILLAGLFAEGPSRVLEPGPSRDHTERWLEWLGVTVRREPSDRGTWIGIDPIPGPWRGRTFDVPPDFSSAAFLLAASLVTPGSRVDVGCGSNPTRTGFLGVLRAMGAEVEVEESSSTPADSPEPRGRVRAHAPRGLTGAAIEGELSVLSLDELPLVMGLAAFAQGVTRIRDAVELRVKESDRLEAMRQVLTGLGIECELEADGADIWGGRPRPGTVDAAGDHRIAMTAVVIGLGVAGTTQIRGADVIDVSYPGFVETLRALGAELEWVADQPG